MKDWYIFYVVFKYTFKTSQKNLLNTKSTKNLTKLSYLISLKIKYAVVFLCSMYNEVVCFVDIGGIVDHQCLNLLFHNKIRCFSVIIVLY
jgi:hypothetical protein